MAPKLKYVQVFNEYDLPVDFVGSLWLFFLLGQRLAHYPSPRLTAKADCSELRLDGAELAVKVRKNTDGSQPDPNHLRTKKWVNVYREFRILLRTNNTTMSVIKLINLGNQFVRGGRGRAQV